MIRKSKKGKIHQGIFSGIGNLVTFLELFWPVLCDLVSDLNFSVTIKHVMVRCMDSY